MLVIRQPIKEEMEGEKYVLPFILKYSIDKVAWIKRFHKEMITLKQKSNISMPSGQLISITYRWLYELTRVKTHRYT